MTSIDALKLARLHGMARRIAEELRSDGLDDVTCERLRVLMHQALVEVGSALPDELLQELGRITAPLECDHPTTCELRVLTAQLVGWIGGIAAAETYEERRVARS